MFSKQLQAPPAKKIISFSCTQLLQHFTESCGFFFLLCKSSYQDFNWSKCWTPKKLSPSVKVSYHCSSHKLSFIKPAEMNNKNSRLSHCTFPGSRLSTVPTRRIDVPDEFPWSQNDKKTWIVWIKSYSNKRKTYPQVFVWRRTSRYEKNWQ